MWSITHPRQNAFEGFSLAELKFKVRYRAEQFVDIACIRPSDRLLATDQRVIPGAKSAERLLLVA